MVHLGSKRMALINNLVQSIFQKNILLRVSPMNPSINPTRSYARNPRRMGRGPVSNTPDSNKTPSEAEELLNNAVVGDKSDFNTPSHLWESNPYTENPEASRRDQSLHAMRPAVDPRDTSIILFPGQGTQFVGMGRETLKYPISRDLFEAANEVLGYDLKKLCFEGPQHTLDETKYCQPAVMVCSLATVEQLKEERPQAIENCVATAGFSVGELTALVFSGAIPYETALRLVKVRAEAMQLASEMVPSGMATVMYGPDSQLGYACKSAREHCLALGIQEPVCSVANHLYPHCKVVAGNKEALQYLHDNASKFKLRRVRPLPVSGAFHTELMRPAVEPFRVALKKIQVYDPIVQVHSNVDGKRYQHSDHIKRQLPKQICKPVCWEQTLHVLYERSQGQKFPRTFECGPGASLKAILKMVNAKAWDSAYNVKA